MFTRTKTTTTVVLTIVDLEFDIDCPRQYFAPLLVYTLAIGKINKVKAIKFIRNELDLGLREAKYFVEDLLANGEAAPVTDDYSHL